MEATPQGLPSSFLAPQDSGIALLLVVWDHLAEAPCGDVFEVDAHPVCDEVCSTCDDRGLSEVEFRPKSARVLGILLSLDLVCPDVDGRPLNDAE
jgi:hypothetical protein